MRGACGCGIEVFAWHGTTDEEYDRLQRRCLAIRPHLVVDDGGDLVQLLSGPCRELADEVIGGCEETTTGVIRLRGLHSQGRLPFPMMAVNDARCKNHFDNPYGTGQSVFDAIMRNTNLQIAGKQVVVAGYGHVGRGVAKVAQGLGARVIVCEIDPVKALEAVMDGMTALPMDEAAALGDLFITVTGCPGCDLPAPFCADEGRRDPGQRRPFRRRGGRCALRAMGEGSPRGAAQHCGLQAGGWQDPVPDV